MVRYQPENPADDLRRRKAKDKNDHDSADVSYAQGRSCRTTLPSVKRVCGTREELHQTSFLLTASILNSTLFHSISLTRLMAYLCNFLPVLVSTFFFFFSSRRRHTRLVSDWSSDVCSSDLEMFSSACFKTFRRVCMCELPHLVQGLGGWTVPVGRS